MRVDSQTVNRLGSLSGVDPDSVSGTVIIDGASYPYRRGRLTVKGRQLMISDDHDLIIDMNRKVFGAVYGGVVRSIKDLSKAQLEAIGQKYRI